MGRSRGGISTNIYACPDALGNAVRLLATGGQVEDGPQALALFAGLNPGKGLANTACGNDETRAYCA